jgi:hypothetical protein
VFFFGIDRIVRERISVTGASLSGTRTALVARDGRVTGFPSSAISLYLTRDIALRRIDHQGRGAAAARIEAVRCHFPSIWFDEATTAGGRDALGWYHEKRDDVRGIGLGPGHDWSSHAADAFGLMCIVYEPPRVRPPKPARRFPDCFGTEGSWMG